MSPQDRELFPQHLIESLPYIRAYWGKTMVVKYGGSAMNNARAAENIIQDVVLMRFVGIRVVLVHGGGNRISEVLDRMGVETRFVDGLRVTDEEAMDVVEMVLAGAVNKHMVSLINQYGGRAIGLCGKDGRLIKARKLKRSGEDLGCVGEVQEIDPHIIQVAEESGHICVVAPIGYGSDGKTYNINADTVAAALAKALQATKLVLLTNVPGILKDPNDPSSLISTVRVQQLQELIGAGVIQRGMLPKVRACIDGITGGVEKAHILSGVQPHALLLEVFTDQGVGTQITP